MNECRNAQLLIKQLLSCNTERCTGPLSCASSAGPHRWPCRSPELPPKSSWAGGTSWKSFKKKKEKKNFHRFAHLHTSPEFQRWLLLLSYFKADVSVANGQPTRLTAQRGSCGWNRRDMHSLCWFLADVLLLIAAADHVPQSSKYPGGHGNTSLFSVFYKAHQSKHTV